MMGFSVDDGYASGTDRQLVDVRVGVSRDPSVVKQPDTAAGEVLGEPRGCQDLALGALCPHACA